MKYSAIIIDFTSWLQNMLLKKIFEHPCQGNLNKQVKKYRSRAWDVKIFQKKNAF